MVTSHSDWIRVTGQPPEWHADYLRRAIATAQRRLAEETDPDERLRASQGLELLKRNLSRVERGEL